MQVLTTIFFVVKQKSLILRVLEKENKRNTVTASLFQDRTATNPELRTQNFELSPYFEKPNLRLYLFQNALGALGAGVGDKDLAQ
jgi:hypothetical protein